MEKISDAVKEPTWLIIYFIKDIYSYEIEVQKQLNALKKVRYRKGIHFFVLTDKFSIEDESAKRKRVYYSCTLNKYEYSTRYGFIEKKINIAGINYHTKDSWHELLEYILKEYSEVSYKLLLSHSHGNAFGIYGEPELSHSKILPLSKILQNRNFIIRSIPESITRVPFIDIDGVFLGNNNEIIVDREKLNITCNNILLLWVKDLEKCLSKGLGSEKKIDIIIMNNCFMQLFDNGYILKDVSTFLMAPEKRIDIADYNFPGLFKKISGNVVTNIEDVNNFILNDFKAHPNTSLVRRSTVLSSIFLSDYELIIRSLNLLLDILINNIILYKNSIHELFAEIRTMDDTEIPISIIDLYNWLNLVSKKINNPSFASEIQNFNTLYEKNIKDRLFVGPGVKEADIHKPKKFSPNGVSIPFPESKELFEQNETLKCSYWGSVIQSGYSLKSLWDDFLLKFYYVN